VVAPSQSAVVPPGGLGARPGPGHAPQSPAHARRRRERRGSPSAGAAPASSQRDLQQVFEHVLHHSIDLFGADQAGLWTVEEGPRPFHLAAQLGLSSPFIKAVTGATRDAKSACQRGAGAAAWRAVAERRAQVVESSGPPSRVGRTPARQVRTWTDCYVPVAVLDEVLGVLVLSHTRLHAWSSSELEQLRSFAGETAGTIQNVRLYSRVQSFAARLEAIKDLAGSLNKIHEVAAIGQVIVAEIRSLFASDTARVYAVDHATRMCEPIAFGGVFLGTADPSPDLLRVEIGRGLTGWVAANNTPVRVADARRDPRRLSVGPTEEPESMLLAPMTYEDVVRGVVVVSAKGFDRYSSDDLTTLSIFAGFAAQSLANAENMERLGRQQTELEQRFAGQRALLQVNETLLGAGDPGVVLELIADGLKSVVRYDNLTIYRLDREQGVRVAVLARDRFADIILAQKIAAGSGLTGWAVERGEAVLANDAHLDPRAMNIPGTPTESESLIVVPLRVGGDVIGTLNVGRMGEAEAHFTPDEFELVKLFAGQASIALQTAEAIHAAELRAERDALTGLRNHGVFQAAVDNLLARGAGTAPTFALLMMDLDGFKAFNDNHGHPAGDRLLRAVAEVLQAGLREDDRVYRYGGDEFAVLLPGVGRGEAQAVADRLAMAVSRLGKADDGPGVTVSIGIAMYPADGRTKDDLVMLADAELYLEKATRRQARPATGGSSAGRGAEYEAAIHESTFMLMARRDPNELLETIVTRAATLGGTSNGYLYLLEPDGEHLRLVVGVGALAEVRDTLLAQGDGVAGRVWASGAPVLVDDYDGWAGRAAGFEHVGRLGGVIGVPLTAGSEVIGVIGLAAGETGRRFDDTDVAALARFARLASVALENARLHAAARAELAMRAQSEADLRAQGDRLRRLADASFEALVIHRNGLVLEVNQTFVDLFGRTGDQVAGTPILELFPIAVRPALAAQFELDTEAPLETLALLGDGSEAAVELIGRTIPTGDEAPVRATAVRDIRERRAIQERLTRQAFYDPLTSLPNRALFLDRTSHALASIPPGDPTPIAVLLLDLDRFRVVNESLGHAVGDQILTAVGRRFSQAIRPGDTLARLGGDEYAVLLDGITDEFSARLIAERLENALATPFDVDGRDINVEASVGLAIGTPGGGAVDLLRDAEIALNRAKTNPLSRVAVFESSMGGASMARLELEGDLRRAVERDELRLHYQPLVDLRTGVVVGHEGLVRWEHPSRGLLDPDGFIPLAEETGLILGIGDWVLVEACRQTRAWQLALPAAPPLMISVNLSGRQFTRPDLATTVARVLAESGLPASSLELEITETVAMSDAAATGVTLRALRELGVRLALDDFGTGYSSLAYLSEMALDRVKVDQSFVAGLSVAGANHSIIAAVAALAHGLGLEVTAEGIEEAEQLAAVIALGCDRGQGYLFERPLPAREAEEALVRHPIRDLQDLVREFAA
jgi:diguanylate cyclase (GGDEF)-like protein/PAS domain S-box-containing protein